MAATRVSYCLLCEGRVSTVYGGYCRRCDARRRDDERALAGGIAYVVIAVLFLVAVVLVFGGGL